MLLRVLLSRDGPHFWGQEKMSDYSEIPHLSLIWISNSAFHYLAFQHVSENGNSDVDCWSPTLKGTRGRFGLFVTNQHFNVLEVQILAPVGLYAAVLVQPFSGSASLNS